MITLALPTSQFRRSVIRLRAMDRGHWLDLAGHRRFGSAQGQPGETDERSMRVLLRDVDRKLFFREREAWTACAEEALDFRHGLLALETMKRLGLRGVELFYWFGNPEWDFGIGSGA